MATVLITGAGGYLAGRLIEDLLRRKMFDRLIGLDVKHSVRNPAVLDVYTVDIRDLETTRIIAGERPDVVVHMAYAVDFLRRTDEEQSVNLGGLERVLAGVQQAGCRQIVVMSSTVVYGAYPGIAPFQGEEDPLCIHPRLPYARDKVLTERKCHDFARGNPTIGTCVVRPAIVVGPNWGNLWAAVFFMLPVLPRIDGHDPAFQFIHEADLVQLLRLCIQKGVAGTFNAAADGALTLGEIATMVGRPTMSVPASLARAGLWALHHLSVLPVGSPPALIEFFSYPWVANNGKAKRVLRFRPRYTSREAFAEAVRIRSDILRNMRRKAPGGYRIFNMLVGNELRRLSRGEPVA